MTTEPSNQLRVRIERLVAGGQGLARVDGQVVLVDAVATGDLVDVQVTERCRGYLRARPRTVVERGPGRREPPCPLANRCGGCDWQHLDYDAQIAAKLAILEESFRRTARLVPPAVTVLRSPELHYRRRARLHVVPRAGSDPIIGFTARHSHDVVHVPQCPVLTPALQAALAILPAHLPLRPSPTTTLIDTGGEEDPVLIAGDGRRGEIAVDGITLAVTPDAFFQANAPLLDALVQRVHAAAGGGEVVWDLFAGVGLFTAGLARRFDRVLAVEGDPRTAELLTANMRALSKVEVTVASVEQAMMKLHHGPTADAIVVDPPREGLSGPVRSAVARSRAQRVVYVSCDPVTLARDVAELVAAGFALESLEILDLFPQTHHFETVALLRGAASPV